MDDKIKLELIGITYNQIEYGVYALVLQQVGGNIRIPIIIGHLEAQAIECKLQEIKPPRPLTHDTMLTALSAFGITLKEVFIKKLPDGVFGADLLLTDGYNEFKIDSRSSDGISLALRSGAPIYTSREVLIEAGFEPESSKETKQKNDILGKGQKGSTKNKLETLSMEQLEEAMMKAAENEDYEEAARIKAEIERRTSNS